MLTRAELKDLRSLSRREGRREHGRFCAEGVRVLEEALRHQRLPEQVLYVPAEGGARAEALVTELAGRGVALHALASSELNRIADARTPQGVVGVFALTDDGDPDPGHEATAVFDGVSDPGNLGALIRSALAFGFDRVVCCGESADPHGPKVVRSTAGALFGVSISRCRAAEFVSNLQRGGACLVATAVDGDPRPARLVEAAAKGPVAVAVGSEGRGLGDELLAAANIRWRISHEPGVESLNAAIAGSIVLREVYEARRRAAGD